MKEVRWTPIAVQSLERTIAFIKKNWTEKELENFRENLESTIERLQLFPQTSTEIKGKRYRRARIDKINSLIFKILPETLDILYIWDGRRNPNSLLRIIKGNKG